MIEVSLTKDGDYYGNIQFFHGCDNAEAIFITECYRCIGLVIIWKRKNDYNTRLFAPLRGVSAFHFPPYERKIGKVVSRNLFKKLQFVFNVYEPIGLVYMGGKIDTPVNKVWYQKSLKDFVFPLIHLFPKIKVQAFKPTPEQNYSTLHMTEEMEFIFENYS